ncbi:MFS transporter, YQGE family, putative transporter [Flavobacterium sp. CF108]|uniref:MFS transporter n=1 Tax=unclassified Flavobacterium TaxID=196869 RepID=UPI0008B5FC50|nr:MULTISPECIES: MFS transporter [unclassified Flavobacterium]SEP34137.1 MFS transporter, YQGE family, putative transporter [Flavobacterium sp. fv08]SHG65500.1 MFS transporter, YQGE family, putative transporter [Flavobacterium sp. CF108]
MFKKLISEIDHFKSQTHNFRILIFTNLVYALVLPVIDIFVAAYIMRNSNDTSKVVIYQLAIYTGIPLTFLLNGFLLKHINIKKLYSIGMMLSGVSMIIMMSLKTLDLIGIGVAGITMGLSFGLYWSNRDYLALSITNDNNRNYYYGLETFIYTIIAIAIPAAIGLFIQSKIGEDQKHQAYEIITAVVFLITIIASIVCYRGKFINPVQKQYIFFKFHPLWYKLLSLAAFKGLAQGFLVTAPAMLIFKILGEEGALGKAQSIGAVLAAIIIYFIGRFSKPSDRIKTFSVGLILFALGACLNGFLFNKMGVIIFLLLLLIAKPLMDLAYFPIQLKVIDIVSRIEKRGEFAYILNHEAGLYLGRLLGAGTFLTLYFVVSEDIALRYAIGIIALLQLCSIYISKKIIKQGLELSPEEETEPKVLEEAAARLL